MTARHREPSADNASARRRGAVLGWLVGVVVVAVCLAGWFAVSAYRVRDDASANTALADVPATEAVVDQVSRALRTSFSYDYTNIDRTKRAARDVLTGRAIEQYDALLERVTQQAAAEQLVLTTAVRSVGVMELRDEHARLLVFLDRQTVRAGNRHESASGQLLVTADRTTGAWKITDIQVL
jgi:Mce-associated membrane protein